MERTLIAGGPSGSSGCCQGLHANLSVHMAVTHLSSAATGARFGMRFATPVFPDGKFRQQSKFPTSWVAPEAKFKQSRFPNSLVGAEAKFRQSRFLGSWDSAEVKFRQQVQYHVLDGQKVSSRGTHLLPVRALKPRERDIRPRDDYPSRILDEDDDDYDYDDEVEARYKSRQRGSSPSTASGTGGGWGGWGGGGSSTGNNRKGQYPTPAPSISSVLGINKFILAGLFVLGIGVGIALDTVVNIEPMNVASREVIDRQTPNPDVCIANGMSAMVLDQRLFITFNPFNVYVSQAEVKPGCVLRQANWRVLESRGLVNSEEVRDCKRNFNTFGFVGDLRQAPEINCVYHSENAENQFLKDPSKAALGDGFQPKDFSEK